MLSKIFTTRHDDELAHKDALLREALLYLCKLFEIRDYGIGLLTPGGMKFQSLIERINSEFAQNESPTQPEDVKRIKNVNGG